MKKASEAAFAAVVSEALKINFSIACKGMSRNRGKKTKSTRFQASAFLLWRCHPDLNRGMKVLQTFALPLGYGTLKIGAVDEARTRDLHLGKVALYQLSYYRL